ncbi:unnamed protein product [Soboliphyme baturini]|uniref:Secreted protein n=1 Tax=Soboliphyme baturini TaxID=241478 RepID=A0A183IMB5_9BILA|nr:unnamed protein product [Soboliphyme baturini]
MFFTPRLPFFRIACYQVICASRPLPCHRFPRSGGTYDRWSDERREPLSGLPTGYQYLLPSQLLIEALSVGRLRW